MPRGYPVSEQEGDWPRQAWGDLMGRAGIQVEHCVCVCAHMCMCMQAGVHVCACRMCTQKGVFSFSVAQFLEMFNIFKQ